MSRDRNRRRSNANTRSTRVKPGRKSRAEIRVERMTALLLVGVFALIYIADQQDIDLPNAAVPFLGAVILLGSALYQYGHRWRVSPWTWMAGTILLMLTVYNVSVDASANFFGVSLLVFAAVLAVGVLTGET